MPFTKFGGQTHHSHVEMLSDNVTNNCKMAFSLHVVDSGWYAVGVISWPTDVRGWLMHCAQPAWCTSSSMILQWLHVILDRSSISCIQSHV